MKQTVRIIGGVYRGKKLYFPNCPGLRPTKDIVKETLFNWLMHDIRGAFCLDAFAGSGSLGFEAFSRGAANVILLEHNVAAYTSLLKNSAAFHSPTLRVLNLDAHHFLQTTTQQFDIVFLDPPFKENLIPDCLTILFKRRLLTRDGMVYIESQGDVFVDANQWQPYKVKKSGQVTYGLYKLLK